MIVRSASLGTYIVRRAGSMPARTSNKLALPYDKRCFRYFRYSWHPHLLFAGERDHSGRSGWHVASRLLLRPDMLD